MGTLYYCNPKKVRIFSCKRINGLQTLRTNQSQTELRKIITALNTPTTIPTIISVGQWIATATLLNDITPLANQKKTDAFKNLLSLCLIPQSMVLIAIAALTAAWSLGNGSVGRWSKIRFCCKEIAVSGLLLSPKYWMIWLTTAASQALKAIAKAACLK